MNKFPVINGLQLTMSFDKFNDSISNLGYQKLDVQNFNDWYQIKSSNKDILSVLFYDNCLNRIIIKNWKKFFGFSDNVTFNNIIDIFTDYYLKNYQYKFHHNSFSETLTYYNNDWVIYFDPRMGERIEIDEKVCHG